jgi:hypothetical protein
MQVCAPKIVRTGGNCIYLCRYDRKKWAKCISFHVMVRFLMFPGLVKNFLAEVQLNMRITPRNLTWPFNYNSVPNSISFLNIRNFLLLVKRTINVLSALTDSPIWTINSALCASSHTVLRNFPLVTKASFTETWINWFFFFFMISADYATYEKYVETCLHVKEDFRKEKTVSA